MMVAQFSQYDPRWAEVKMTETMTLARSGCLITDVAMGLKNYAIETDPGKLCIALRGINGLDEWGNLKHEAIEQLYPNVLFYERVYTTNSPSQAQKMLIGAAIDHIKTLLALGQPVMLEVDNVGGDGQPDHWVLAKKYQNGDFLINNPDGGVEQWFSTRYGDPSQKLFGYYALIGPPVDEPTGLGTLWWKAGQVARGKNVQTYAQEIFKEFINVRV